jgi:NAD(P)-dependent dehydrogenase (short-subunit alcohol dehydrogenase family)
LLLNKVKESKEGRIINVSSLAHKGSGKKTTIDFEDYMAEKSYVPWTSYFYSKLSNVYFTRELAK